MIFHSVSPCSLSNAFSANKAHVEAAVPLYGLFDYVMENEYLFRCTGTSFSPESSLFFMQQFICFLRYPLGDNPPQNNGCILSTVSFLVSFYTMLVLLSVEVLLWTSSHWGSFVMNFQSLGNPSVYHIDWDVYNHDSSAGMFSTPGTFLFFISFNTLFISSWLMVPTLMSSSLCCWSVSAVIGGSSRFYISSKCSLHRLLMSCSLLSTSSSLLFTMFMLRNGSLHIFLTMPYASFICPLFKALSESSAMSLMNWRLSFLIPLFTSWSFCLYSLPTLALTLSDMAPSSLAFRFHLSSTFFQLSPLIHTLLFPVLYPRTSLADSVYTF